MQASKTDVREACRMMNMQDRGLWSLADSCLLIESGVTLVHRSRGQRVGEIHHACHEF